MAEQNMESLDSRDLAKAMGVDLPEVEAVKNTGTTYFEHKEGDYDIIVLDYSEKILNADKKEVPKGTPGSTVHGSLRCAIARDPEGQLLTNQLTFPDDVPYGRCLFQQYITHDSDRQYTNKNVLAGFYIENVPQLAVVQDPDSRDFIVNLANLGFYYGAPAKMTLTKKTKSGEAKRAFVQGAIELVSHKLDKETFAKRKQIADRISENLKAKLAKEQAEREANNKEKKSDASKMKPKGVEEEEISSLDNYMKE